MKKVKVKLDGESYYRLIEINHCGEVGVVSVREIRNQVSFNGGWICFVGIADYISL
jgi:hypothetical protein